MFASPFHSSRFASVHRTLLTCSAVALLAMVPLAAQAQVSFFTNRATFTAANPGLVSEGFEASSSGTNRVITGAISSTTSATTGLTVTPNFTVQAVGTTGVPGSGGNSFYYNNETSYNAGDGTSVLTTNSSADSQDITFSSAESAFGFDMGSNGGTYTVSVFNTTGSQIASTTVTPTAGSFAFLGMTSSVSIGRVNVNATSYESTDNMLIGTGSASAPEPGSVALLALSGLPVVGMIARRRRRAANL